MSGGLKSMFTNVTSQTATTQATKPVPVLSDKELAEQKKTLAEQKSANYREETLNGMAFCIGNGLINAMSDSIVQWINNGFKNPDGTSGPGFLSNPGQFFQQIANQAVGGFFQGLGPIGNIVCKPFDLKIRLALLNQYNNNGSGQQQCTLDSIKQNFSRFGQGGNYMGDWFQLTQQDQNNAMGSYFIARDQMAKGIEYDVSKNKVEVDLGKGFLNLKKCVKYSTTAKDLNTGKPQCTEWKTTTPGSEVQASLDRAMSSKTHRLEIATNFNQIVSALVNQIVIKAMSGLSGGMGSGGGGGSSNNNDFGNNYDYTYSNIDDTGATTVTSTTPTISAINPVSGAVGTQITIIGTGFLPTGNTIRLNNLTNWISNLPSNGTSITFTMPTKYPDQTPVASGNTLPLSVQNANGTSFEKMFTVTGAFDSGLGL
jgi:hypothetical protein